MSNQGLFSIYELGRLGANLDHPECVACGPDGKLYAGSESGDVFRLDPDTGLQETIGHVGGSIGGIALDGGGNLYECNYGKCVVQKLSIDGKASLFSEGSEGCKAVYPNYPVFDRQGNLFYSDSGDYYRPGGRIFVVRRGGRTELASGSHLHFPNGLAIDPEGQWLYAVQSIAPNIIRFPLRDGALGEPEIYLPLSNCVPDGLAFAASGNLYVACYVPDCIFRITPRRTLELVVRDHGADFLTRPTNVAFRPGDPNLYYANLGGFHIGSVPVGEYGAPLHFPTLA
jgi:gluconolactonase